MKITFAALLLSLIPGPSFALDDALVDGTSWNVGVYDRNGARGAVHPVPWEFRADGSVFAGKLWTGAWKLREGNTVSVVITHQNASKDSFEVNFLTDRQFIAFKNGKPYRYGQRK